MAIISKETFEKFTEEEKEAVFTAYQSDRTADGDRYFEGSVNTFEQLFGKENLQPEPEIKTWVDVEKEHPEHFCRSNVPNPMLIPSQELRDKLLKKSIATYKIATLIELGYGGMVTDEEWKDTTSNKFSIEWDEEDNCPTIRCHCSRNWADFISFHTKQQAEEFMSYPENRELIKQYYMI